MCLSTMNVSWRMRLLVNKIIVCKGSYFSSYNNNTGVPNQCVLDSGDTAGAALLWATSPYSVGLGSLWPVCRGAAMPRGRDASGR